MSNIFRYWMKLVKSTELSETPIEDFNLVGDWSKNSSFRHEQDRKLLTNPKAQEKIIHKWQKTIVPFNMYFVNSPEANRHTEIGKVDYAWLAANMPKTLKSLKIRDDAVNVIFTNNKGDERAPMTAWVIAHRLGHVLKFESTFDAIVKTIERTLRDIIRKLYGKSEPLNRDGSDRNRDYDAMKLKLLSHIGTFKSARDGNLRSAFEFNYELLAQYIITGSIKFNPLPSSFGHGIMAWGKHTKFARAQPGIDIETCNDELSHLAKVLTYDFESLLEECVGEIFVM